MIHQTAILEDGAVVGEGTNLWVNCQVRAGARIGKNCNIGKDTYIDADVVIGDGCKIQNGVSVYHGVTIEDGVFIGPNVTFTNDRFPRAFTTDWEVTPTLVREGASVGANATLRCGVTLGEYCTVGCGSVVVDDVPPYTLVAGNPARKIGMVCRCGCKLDGQGVCPSCSRAGESGEGVNQ